MFYVIQRLLTAKLEFSISVKMHYDIIKIRLINDI